MSTRITKLADFKGDGSIVEFDASVLSIKHEGKPDEKKPLAITMKLEATGEVFNAVSWNFDILNDVKSMSHSLKVAVFEGTSSVYRDQLQIKIGKIKEILLQPSSQKQMSKTTTIRDEVIRFIDENIQDSACLNLLNILVKNNNDYFVWPAARGIHHSFEGGLALHSLNTAKHALSYINIYGDACVDKDIMLTGALLHDIGKLKEYTKDCEISFEGNFMTHLVSGVVIVDRITQSWPSTPRNNKIITIIKHIIQSHHDKMEFGSPVTPKCMEASIVSMCDLADSRYEALSQSYKNMMMGTFSDPQKVLNGSKIYKWDL